MSLCLAVAALMVGLAVCPASAGWEEELEGLLAVGEEIDTGAAVRSIVQQDPDWRDIAERIQSAPRPDAVGVGEAVLRTTVCIDSVERPWVLSVPASYDPAVPTPLLMVVHGGVGGADLFDDPMGYVAEDETAALAMEHGWIAVYPFGQAGATWWDEVGMANIRGLIRTVKREFNIDDDRVWMGGFSDGASAGFTHAMLEPSDYAAFVALNGHMGVPSLDGDLPVYAPNMAATPIYATTTFDDGLYPSRKMRATIEMARAAGADIHYREFPGTHDFNDVVDALPGIARFLDRHPRDPFPSRICWEAGDAEFGQCRWLSIDRITIEDPAPWHEEHNATLVDDRVTIGFQPDYEFEGPGIRVGVLSDGDYPARNIGLQAGDVIVRTDDARMDSLPDLNDWKDTVERGDEFEMAVLREGGEVVLRGELPEPSAYLVFKRDVPSGAIRASFAANHLTVETSRVGAFRVLVHPDMVTLGQNLVIEVDGEVVFDEVVQPDIGFMLENYIENRDRSLLYVAEVLVNLE